MYKYTTLNLPLAVTCDEDLNSECPNLVLTILKVWAFARCHRFATFDHYKDHPQSVFALHGEPTEIRHV